MLGWGLSCLPLAGQNLRLAIRAGGMLSTLGRMREYARVWP
jgi:hypothetical protein